VALPRPDRDCYVGMTTQTIRIALALIETTVYFVWRFLESKSGKSTRKVNAHDDESAVFSFEFSRGRRARGCPGDADRDLTAHRRAARSHLGVG